MQHIGRYEVEQEIGRGSMGVVYLAHDPRVRRTLAIKTLSAPQGLTPQRQQEFHERFLREAQTAGALDHPAIVTIYDAGEDPTTGAPFIAMEYVSGSNLRDRLDDGPPLSVPEVLALVDSVAAGLQLAHDAGILHRDIKPANILIRRQDGAAKLADFGIARPSTSQLTSSGQSLGSPAYMSPEQIQGRPLDRCSDLFALAVVLYECLAGRRPFAGDDMSSLAYAVVHQHPVPVSRLNSNLPPALDRFFEQALAKDPARRFAHGYAFRQALQEAGRSHPGDDSQHTMAASGLLVENIADEVSGDCQTPPQGLVQAAGAMVAATGRLLAPLGPALCSAAGTAFAVAAAAARSCKRGVLAGLREWQGLPARSRRVLLVALVAVVALAGAALFLMDPGAAVTLQVKNSMEQGSLTVLVDGRTVYAGTLEADRRQVKAFGRKLAEWGNQEFTRDLSVAAGKRQIRVIVERAGQPPLEQVLSARLESGEERRLKVTTGGRLGDSLSVKLN